MGGAASVSSQPLCLGPAWVGGLQGAGFCKGSPGGPFTLRIQDPDGCPVGQWAVLPAFPETPQSGLRGPPWAASLRSSIPAEKQQPAHSTKSQCFISKILQKSLSSGGPRSLGHGYGSCANVNLRVGVARARGGGADSVTCSCPSPNLGVPSGQAGRGPPNRTRSADTSRGSTRVLVSGRWGSGLGSSGPGRAQLEPQQQRLGASWGPRAGAGAGAAALAQGRWEAQRRGAMTTRWAGSWLERVGAGVSNSNSSRGTWGPAAGGAGTWQPGPRAGLSSAPLSSGSPLRGPPLAGLRRLLLAGSLWRTGGRAVPGAAAGVPGA